MSDRVQQVILLWKEFNLNQYQRDLDKTASEIADRQDRSETSRKKLIELSKTFKRESSEEVRKEVADLLKSFQNEIDSLSSRSKAAEVAFLATYKALLDLPDPTLAFNQISTLQERAARVVELESENQRLRSRNQEYEAEFQELRNQDVTVKQLRDRVKALEEELESTITSHGEEARRAIEEEFEDRQKALKENQSILTKKLGESERRVLQLQKALDAAQTELFDARSKDEIKSHGRSEEVDLILGDLDKALQRAILAEKECEELRAALGDRRNKADDSNAAEVADMTKIIKNLQIELGAKDKDIERLVEEVSKTKTSMQFQTERMSADVHRLTQEVSVMKTALNEAESRLERQSDYEDLRKEVDTFRAVEFGATDSETEGSEEGSVRKSLEVMLMRKNKALQASLTGLKVNHSDLSTQATHLAAENERLTRVVRDQRELVSKLEKDLADVQNVSALCRGEGEGQPAPSASDWVLEAVSGLGTSPEPPFFSATSPTRMMDPATAAENLLPIVSAQRERFRERNQELEARNSQLLEQMALLQTELESLRGDNLKLYEKIRFLQSYSSSSASSVVINTPAEDRYSSQYEAKLDPFASFSKKELMRKVADLSPYEKFTLSMGRAILSNKTARIMTLVYTFLLHGLVVLVLYKLAYTEECKQDAAAECVKRFADHMAQAHSEHR